MKIPSLWRRKEQRKHTCLLLNRHFEKEEQKPTSGGAHIVSLALRFGIRRRKVVVVEVKKPGEQEGVFVHLSCPVLSMMSHSRVLSIQPAEQASRLIHRHKLVF